MEPRKRLARNIVFESKAYGYTLTIWGSGAILISRYGMASVLQIFSYVVGALLAFFTLALVTFKTLFRETETSGDQQVIVTSIVHVFATFGNLVISYLIVRYMLISWLPVAVLFLAVGFQATFLYNVFLLVEEATARALK